MGGSGKQKALALIGDRLLDLKLYESLYVAGEEREGWMTQKRSMLVSNENLSRYGSDMLIPSILSRKEYNLLSTHEKGTVVEAYIGALYVQEGYTIPRVLTNLVNKIISTLQSYFNIDDHISSLSSSSTLPASSLSSSSSALTITNSSATSSSSALPTQSTLFLKSQYKPPADRKKAKSTLLEVLQKRGVTKATNFFTTWSIENPNFPPFISKFEPNFDLIHCNLPDPGPVIGEICPSKKEAEESVATKVLQFFRERELMVFAPPEKRALLSSASLNPPSLPEQVAAITEKYSLNGDSNTPSPTYSTLEIDQGVVIHIVTGGSVDEILEKSREDAASGTSAIASPEDLPDSLSLPEEFKNPHKRLLDPKQWHLCTSDSLVSIPTNNTSTIPSTSLSSSSSSLTIYDGPYQKKFRPSTSSDGLTGTTIAEETEEGEIVMEELEINEAIAREREEENRKIKENLIALRKARAMAEKKKVENFRKYATRKRE
jgi:hypothetical protein